MLTIDKNKRGSGVIIDERQNRGLVDLIVGVDAGSTQTRVAMCTQEEGRAFMGSDVTETLYNKLKEEVYIIPSTYAAVPDEREIKPNSDNLEDNYDSHIIRVRTSAVKPLVGSERVVRGQKIKDASGLVTRYLDSSTNKMDNTIFYINVLDGIGYAALQKFSGNIPSEINVNLVLSVRPKELNSLCQEKMNSNFIGEFIFRWKGVNLTIKINNIMYTTEPEAQISGTGAIMDLAALLTNDYDCRAMSDKFNNSDSYIHIEGGGSSIGVEVVKDGNIIDACSSTFQLGGNYLMRVAMDRLREVKGRAVSEESVRAAIQTCLLKNGREREDITDVMAACKNQVGLDILERLRHEVIDITPDLSLLDMDFITLGGRLFAEDEAGQSIGTYFANYLKQISPNTDVIILKDNYIPQGNLIIGINELLPSEEQEADAVATASSYVSPYAGTADEE